MTHAPATPGSGGNGARKLPWTIRKTFARSSGFLLDNTAAACLTVANEMAREATHDPKALSILYDQGLWYVR
jgi:hypothetical protein